MAVPDDAATVAAPSPDGRRVADDSAASRVGWPAFVVLAALAAGADLASKWLIFRRLGMPGESPAIPLIPGMLSLETNLNEGALFGMGQGFGLFFAAVSLAAIVGILALVSRPATRQDGWLLAALALITGGVIGNLYDRLGLPGLAWHFPPERRGQPVLAVRDWIHFQLEGVIDWPIFNLADSWLVVGAGLLVLLSLRAPPPDSAREHTA
jgi:signal peptidase II